MEVKTFILENTENLDKLSCHSHDPEILELISNLEKKGVSLNELSFKISYSSGKWELTNKDYVPENFPNSIHLLKIININPSGKIMETPKDNFIPQSLHRKWKGSQIIKNDLIVSIAGTMGKVALFNKNYEANINQNLAFIRLKKKYASIKILPEFIHLYLNSYFAFEQFNFYGGHRAGQSGLSLKELKNMQVILPSETKQKEILKKINSLKKEITTEHDNYIKFLRKLNTTLDEYTNLDLTKISKTWIVPNKKIFDRIDCYFNSQQLEKIHKIINDLDKTKFNVVKANKLEIVSVVDKEEREKNKTHLFKYVDIGNTEKDLGWILGFEEDILFNLPSRAKMKANENDILIPRPIGSTQGILKVTSKYDGELFTTGNIQIRPRDEDEAVLLWVMLKSDIMQKQFFYLQSGCSQPEISPNNFKKYVLFPFPNGKIKDEIIKKSKKHYETALKHRTKIIYLKNKINEVFEQEIKKFI